jgi:MbtH protein
VLTTICRLLASSVGSATGAQLLNASSAEGPAARVWDGAVGKGQGFAVSHQRSKDRYLVVVNHEAQYAIWRADLEVPDGWTTVGEEDSKVRCLEFIQQTWKDMRPLKLRR